MMMLMAFIINIIMMITNIGNLCARVCSKLFTLKKYF